MLNDAISILVIDDDVAVLKSVQLFLKKSGWKVAVLSDLSQGLEMERCALPDVILCDAAMPDISGPQLIGVLKADPATADIPVILMTGYADAGMFSHVPWTCFLEKPFSSKQLIAAIQSAAKAAIPPKLPTAPVKSEANQVV